MDKVWQISRSAGRTCLEGGLPAWYGLDDIKHVTVTLVSLLSDFICTKWMAIQKLDHSSWMLSSGCDAAAVWNFVETYTTYSCFSIGHSDGPRHNGVLGGVTKANLAFATMICICWTFRSSIQPTHCEQPAFTSSSVSLDVTSMHNDEYASAETLMDRLWTKEWRTV